ncbi:hypothetical protein LCGC14_0603030 [marine sediment metagenome]|uniref:Uncharacterized protein n=1 Tax=marine sediment metagenome TaxID=412755 RepID=A0A0F9UIE5_9ZZZZ
MNYKIEYEKQHRKYQREHRKREKERMKKLHKNNNTSYITWYGSNYVKIGKGDMKRAKAGNIYHKECVVLLCTDEYSEKQLQSKFSYLNLRNLRFKEAGKELFKIDDKLIKFIQEISQGVKIIDLKIIKKLKEFINI